MALPVTNNGLFRTFSNKMKPPTDLLTSSTSPTNNSSTRSRLSFSVDSLLSRKQVVDQHQLVDENESDDNDSDESVDVEDTSSDVDEKVSPSTSPTSRLPASLQLHNNNNDDLARSEANMDESFKESPVLRHPPFLAGIVAMAAAAAAAANSSSPTPSTTTPSTTTPSTTTSTPSHHIQPWPSPGPGFHMGMHGLRPPLFHKPGGEWQTVLHAYRLLSLYCNFVT